MFLTTQEWRRALEIQIYEDYVFMVDRAGYKGTEMFLFLEVLFDLLGSHQRGQKTVPFHSMLLGVSDITRILTQEAPLGVASHFQKEANIAMDENEFLLCIQHAAPRKSKDHFTLGF